MKLSYLLSCLIFLMLFSTTEVLAVHRVSPESAVERVEGNEAAALSKKELRKQERKEKREMRQQIKEWFKGMRGTMDDSLLLLVLVTILLPPLGMYLYEGAITTRFWISLLLTLLFYVPGLIYTLVVILSES